MVDSIGSGGQTPKVASANTIQKPTAKQDVKTETGNQSDEVSLSEEALSLSNAQQTAEQTAAQLSEDGTLTLSSNEDRLNSLV